MLNMQKDRLDLSIIPYVVYRKEIMQKMVKGEAKKERKKGIKGCKKKRKQGKKIII
jgi:hypothetical protein